MIITKDWQQKQPIKGPELVCKYCGNKDFLWFCSERQPGDLDEGSGQYKWQWTPCCQSFMELTNGLDRD